MRNRHLFVLQMTSLALLGLLLAALATPAGAATLVVADGAVTVAADGVCSLIEAIDNANDTATGQPHVDCAAGDPGGADTITLPAGGRYTLTAAFTAHDGLPLVTGRITIKGNGATIQRWENAPDFRILSIAGAGDLTLSDLTLSRGRVVGAGGAIFNEGSLVLDGAILTDHISRGGGALSNYGAAIIRDSILDDNSAVAASASEGIGGAVTNFGALSIEGSAIADDYAAGPGGGLYNAAGATLTVVNSTLFRNRASDVKGGGLYNNGTATLTHVTVMGNSAAVQSNLVNASGLYNDSAATLTLRHSLITGNSGPTEGISFRNEIANLGGGVVNADDYNLIGHGGAANVVGFTPGPTDITPDEPPHYIVGEDLIDNGGPTHTLALRVGSPGIDVVPSAKCDVAPINVDQRGLPRGVDGDRAASSDECDVGAYEAQGVPQVQWVEIAEEYAEATWFYIDEAGVSTYVVVGVTEWTTNPDRRDYEPLLAVGIFQDDAESFPIHHLVAPAVIGPQPSFDFTINQGLRSARVTGSAIAAELGKPIQHLTIDLTWESTGPVMASSGRSVSDEGPFEITVSDHFRIREAVATGSVILNGVNLTPLPSMAATIQENELVFVTRPRP